MLALSDASCAGVQVDMIVRGICCMRAGVPNATENIRIRSIVGRYLEHSRIYAFGAEGRLRVYIASGDFLTRNTERRVEVGVRIRDAALIQKLMGLLDLELRDNVNARQMRPDGSYVKVKPAEGEPLVDSQMALYEYFKDGFSLPAAKAPAKKPKPAARPKPAPKKGLLAKLIGRRR